MKLQSTTTMPSFVPKAEDLSATAAVDTETLELLEAWAREDATEDPGKLKNAQQELDEFKRAMNENRAVCRERILYP